MFNFTGYAIIQLPELIILIYKQVKRLISSRNVSRSIGTEHSNADMIMVSTLGGGITETEEENTEDRDCVDVIANRLSGDEQLISNFIGNKISEAIDRYECKLDTKLLQITRKMDRTLDEIKDKYESHNPETQVYKSMPTEDVVNDTMSQIQLDGGYNSRDTTFALQQIHNRLRKIEHQIAKITRK